MSSKKSRLRFYADENIPVTSVTYLKAKGISIVHAFDYGFIEKPDKEHVQKSKSLKRILISLDKDVKKFKNVFLIDHPGIILLSTGDITPNHLNKLLDKAIKYVTPSFAKNALIKITIRKITKEKDGKITKKILV